MTKKEKSQATMRWRDRFKARDPEGYKEWRNNLNRKSYTKRVYGITPAQKEEMLANQGGACCICGTTNPPPDKSNPKGWCIDHCHKYQRETGGIKIRGILCIHCNCLLGMAKESVETLESAIRYLKKHNS